MLDKHEALTSEALTKVIGGSDALPDATSKEYKIGMQIYGKYRCPFCKEVFSPNATYNQQFCFEHARQDIDSGKC